jgi:chitodextrinase
MRTNAERTGALCAAVLFLHALSIVTPVLVRADDAVPATPREWNLLDAPPGPPGGLRVEASGEKAAWVKWNPSDDDEAVVAYEVFRGGTLAGRTRSLSITDSGLAPAARYCYSVRAVDGAGRFSGSTASVCVTTPDLTPPEAPSAPTVVLDSPTSVAASWGPSSDNVGVAGYEILRGGRLHLSLSGLQASDGSLRPAQTYCYSVRAFDRAGNRSDPSPAVCVTPPDLTPPTPPRVVASPGPRMLTLDWPASVDDVGVAGYEIFRGEELVATTRALAAVRTELAAGRHCFAVRAFDAAGNRSASVEACGVVPDTTPPSAPTALEAAAPGETSVVLHWSPSSDDVGVAGYEVHRDEEVIARTVQTGGGDEGLRPSVVYCYTIRAYDAAGNHSDPSAPACVMTPDLTPPVAPSLAAATPLSDRSLRLAWLAASDNVGVAGYEILRDGAVVARSSEPAAEVKGLSPGRDYCFEVRAYDAAGHRSPHASPACAHTPDLTPPTVPGGLIAAATSSSRVAVGWSPSVDDVGVAGYELWRGDVLVTRSRSTTWLETDLGPASEYCYHLRAFDAAGNLSDPSSSICARTTAAGTPAAPVDLEVAPVSTRAVALKWKPSPDPGVVYAVFWDGEKRIGSTRFLTYKVDGLKPGQRRCFQVAAIDATGNSSPKTWPVCAVTSAGSSAAVR